MDVLGTHTVLCRFPAFLCPDTVFCTQVQKVSLDHLGSLGLLGPQGLQVNVKVKPKQSFRRTSTAANAQVRHVLYQMMIPWLEKLKTEPLVLQKKLNVS